MKKATDALLSDHKMIRKLLESFRIDNPRYSDISLTLSRVVLSHAWFEDNVFLPAFQAEPLLEKRYMDELYTEHKDIDHMLSLVRKTQTPKELDAHMKQFRAILENHLKKEEDALFPIAESVLDCEGMNRLSADMERRQGEAQKLFNAR